MDRWKSQDYVDRIVPVISLILYFGTKQHWNSPKTLQSLMKIPRQLQNYVNDCHIQVFEIAWLPDKRTIKHVDEVLKLLSVMSDDNRYEKILSFSNEK